MSPAMSATLTALDNAKQNLAILTAASVVAKAQYDQALEYHKQTYRAVVKATQDMKALRKAHDDATEAEYAVPDNPPLDGDTGFGGSNCFARVVNDQSVPEFAHAESLVLVPFPIACTFQ